MEGGSISLSSHGFPPVEGSQEMQVKPLMSVHGMGRALPPPSVAFPQGRQRHEADIPTFTPSRF